MTAISVIRQLPRKTRIMSGDQDGADDALVDQAVDGLADVTPTGP